jgi:hypothetical protein
MKKECYLLDADETKENFSFLSEGPKGQIKKAIKFQRIKQNFFNLCFGDWDEENGMINSKTRTNNGDREKILATVADSVITFMENHPDALILAKGETAARTRLYQMGINKHLVEITALYIVKGFKKGRWHSFEPG